MAYIIGLLLVGLVAGCLSGLIGIGGGIIIIPALFYLFSFSQHKAQGTTLALMVPPIGVLAAYNYYKAGNVNIKAAIFIALGFVVGGLIGAHFAGQLPEKTLSRIFAIILILIGARTLFV